MIRSSFPLGSAAVLVLALLDNSAAATIIPPATAYDTAPRDGKLSAEEQRAYKAGLLDAFAEGADRHAILREVFVLEAAQEGAGGAPVPLLMLEPGPNRRACGGSKQRFYLRAEIHATPLLGCDGLDTSADGAKVSFEHDGIGDDTTLLFDFGLAIPLIPDPQPIDPGLSLGGLSLTDYGIALFVEGHGAVKENAGNSGTMQSGLLFDAVYEGSALAYLGLSSAVYYQHYLNGDGSGVGASLTLTPADAGLRINATPGGRENKAVTSYFTTSLMLDAIHVTSPGNTGFAAGEDFAWGIFNFGYLYADDRLGTHGARFKVGSQFAADLVSGRDAILLSASAGLYLDATQTTALDLGWQKGTDYKTMEKVDSVTLGLTLKF